VNFNIFEHDERAKRTDAYQAARQRERAPIRGCAAAVGEQGGAIVRRVLAGDVPEVTGFE